MLRFLTFLPATVAAACYLAAPACAAASEPADSRVLIVPVGTTREISLPSNGSTGYGWQLVEPLPKDSPVSVTLQPETSAPTPDEEPLCGAPGVTVVTLVGLHRGTATVRLQYVRPWEKDRPAARTKRLVVTVE